MDPSRFPLQPSSSESQPLRSSTTLTTTPVDISSPPTHSYRNQNQSSQQQQQPQSLTLSSSSSVRGIKRRLQDREREEEGDKSNQDNNQSIVIKSEGERSKNENQKSSIVTRKGNSMMTMTNKVTTDNGDNGGGSGGGGNGGGEDEEQSSQEVEEVRAGTEIGGGVGKKGKKKTKRKQLIACDACRLRRVKCGRTEGYGACPQCKQRGIQCTSNYILQKAKTPRAGKIVQQAKLLYGSTIPETNIPAELLLQEQQQGGAQGHNTLSSLSGTGNSPESQTQIKQLQTCTTGSNRLSSSPQLSPILESNPGFENLARNLSKHLVETFLVMGHEQLPVLNVTLFRNWFEEASGTGEFGVVGSCLVAVMEAYGARITDSALVIGPTAPRFADLKLNTNRVIDLSPYGRTREQFANYMLERALRKIDQAGVFRKPTPEGAAALMLLELLMDYRDPWCKEGRFLLSGAVEHVRNLKEKELGGLGEKVLSSTQNWWNGRVRSNSLWWGLYVRDAWTSCVGGMIPHFTNFDLEIMSPDLVNVKYENLIKSLETADGTTLSQFVLFGTLGHLMSLARIIAENVTQVLPRSKQYLNLSVIKRFFHGLDENSSLLAAWTARRGTNTSRNKAQDRMVVFLTGNILIKVHQVLRDRFMETQAKYNGGPPSEDDSEEFIYYRDLQDLKAESDGRMFRCSREVARCVKEATASSHLYGGALGLPQLGLHGKALLDMPTIEYNGPNDWTIQDKIHELTWILDGLKSIGWSWGDLESYIPVFETALSQLKGPSITTTTPTYNSPISYASSIPSYGQFPPQPVLAPIQIASGMTAPLSRSPPTSHLIQQTIPSQDDYYVSQRSSTMSISTVSNISNVATTTSSRSASWVGPPPPSHTQMFSQSQAPYQSFHLPQNPTPDWHSFAQHHDPQQSFIQPPPQHLHRQYPPPQRSEDFWARDNRPPSWDASSSSQQQQHPSHSHQYAPPS